MCGFLATGEIPGYIAIKEGFGPKWSDSDHFGRFRPVLNRPKLTPLPCYRTIFRPRGGRKSPFGENSCYSEISPFDGEISLQLHTTEEIRWEKSGKIRVFYRCKIHVFHGFLDYSWSHGRKRPEISQILTLSESALWALSNEKSRHFTSGNPVDFRIY